MKHSFHTAALRSLLAIVVASATANAAIAYADEDLNSTQAANQHKPGVAAKGQPAISVPTMPKSPTIAPIRKKRSSVLTLTGRGTSPIIITDAEGNVVEKIELRTIRPLNRFNQKALEREAGRRRAVLEEFARVQELRVKKLTEAQEAMKVKADELMKAQEQALRDREIETQTRAKMLEEVTPVLSEAARKRMERGAKSVVKRKSSIRRPRSVRKRRLNFR